MCVVEVVGCVRDSCLDSVLAEGSGDLLRRVEVFDNVECFAIFEGPGSNLPTRLIHNLVLHRASLLVHEEYSSSGPQTV